MTDRWSSDPADLDPEATGLRRLPDLSGATDTISLDTLCTDHVTSSGSFDSGGGIWLTTFGKLLQTLPLPAMLLDSRHRVIAANQACARLGAVQEEIVHTDFAGLFPNHDTRLQGLHLLEQVFSTRQSQVGEALLKIQAKSVWARMTLRSIRVKGHQYALLLIEDLTLQKRQQLEENVQRQELERRVGERTAELEQVTEQLRRGIAHRERVEEELVKAQADLEVRVEERTAELMRANEELRQEIHRREQAERELASSKARLEFLLSSSPAVLYTAHPSRTYDLTFVSDNVASHLGYPPEALLRRPAQRLALVHPDDLPEVMARLSVLPEHRHPVMEYRFLVGDGSWRWVRDQTNLVVDEDGNPLEIVGCWLDVHDQKRVELALSETSSRLNALIEATPDIIYFKDLDGRFLTINKAFERLTGLSRDGSLGRTTEEVLPADAAEGNRSSDLEVVEKGGPVLWEHRVSDASGKVAALEALKFPVFGAQGTIVGLGGVCRNVTERNEMHRALMLEKQKFEALARYLPFGLVLIQPDGTFEYLNPRFTELFGYDPSDVPNGREWFRKAFPDPDHRHEVIRSWIEHVAEARPGAPKAKTLTVQCKDGTRKIVELLTVQVESGSCVTTFEDVTDRRRARKALQESRQTLQLALEGGNLATWDWDIISGRMVFSERMANVLGYSVDELVPHFSNWGQLVHPDDVEALRNAFSDHISGAAPMIENEHRLRHKSGKWIWNFARGKVVQWDEDGSPMRMIGINYDVSDRKNAEDALRASEIKYRELCELLPQFVYEIDAQGGLLFVNRSTEQVLGYTLEELSTPGMSLLDLAAPEDRQRLTENFLKVVRGEKVASNEYTLRKKDGTAFQVVTYSSPIVRDGQVAGVRGVAVDITDRIRAEDQVRASLEEKEVLLREVHHRVKNNLQIISSLLALQSFSLKDDTFRNIFKEAESRIWSMALVHENLYRSENISQIKAYDYFTKLLFELRYTYPVSDCLMDVEVQDKELSLQLDTAVPLGLILHELVSNALKHAFPGRQAGKIWVAIRATDPELLELVVGDDGIGLPPDFDVSGSTTFGLSLVQTLVQQLRGTIQLMRGEGTQFAITFSSTRKKVAYQEGTQSIRSMPRAADR